MVKVDEPDDDTACLMLRGLKARYAQHHGVHMLDSAIQTAVRLSRRYLTGRQLPDKAVDLLDTAGARVRMSLDTLPEPLTQLHVRLAALDIEREAIEQDSVFYPEASPERLAELTDLRDELQAEAGHLEAQYQQEKALAQQIMTLRQEGTDSTELQQQLRTHQGFAPLLALDVDARAVATVVADWTGIPLSSLLKDEQSDLLSMEQSLENRVVGQSPALCAIAQRLRAAKTGLTPENGPQGVFLLTGPSGTGKTETALTLADTLFGGEKSLITINLSEYQEPHTVSQLKGSPPGYVGYGQGGVLTEAVRKRPYSVVLLDEVEKAHRDVMNLFYQVFDRGFMRDGEGREIDFRNTVILMTANLGSDHIMQLLEEKPDATDADLHELLYPLLREHFQPALMARFQTVIYRPLGQEAMRAIVEMKLAQVARRLHQHYGLETEISNSLYDALTAACLLPDTGARNIDSLLNQQILPVLSQQLLAQQAVLETVDQNAELPLAQIQHKFCKWEARVRFSEGTRAFGVRLCQDERTGEAYDFRLLVGENRLSFDRIPFIPSDVNNKGLERPIRLSAGEEYRLQLIVDDDIAVLYVNGVALSVRMYRQPGTGISLYVTDGRLEILESSISDRLKD